MQNDRKALREELISLLERGNAHASFDDVMARAAEEVRGKRPESLPYSPWELLEHIRIAQADILDYCVNPDYRELKWPDDYWPADSAPPNPEEWDGSVRQVKNDRAKLIRLVHDEEIDLLGPLPSGADKTLLRETLIAAGHMSYHLGQLVVVLRLLGAWED